MDNEKAIRDMEAIAARNFSYIPNGSLRKRIEKLKAAGGQSASQDVLKKRNAAAKAAQIASGQLVDA